MQMDKIEEKLEKNAQDIGELTASMRELAAITKNMEKRHEESMGTVRDAMLGIQKLLEKDIEAIKSISTENKSDVRVLKHDLNNLKNSMNALPEMNKIVIATQSKVEALDDWKNKVSSSIATSKTWVMALWAVLLAIGGFIGWAISFFTGGSDVDVQP